MVIAAAACGDAEVEVQPLPPLARPSAEARAGLPEVAGVWRFAGFEVPPQDSAAAAASAPAPPAQPPGEFRISLQRLDSLAGSYARNGAVFPLIGEVRRDGIFSVLAFGPEGVGQFAAGRVVRDTLWIELSSFSAAATWPQGARAALVRTPVRAPFRRLIGGAAIAGPVDSTRLDSAGITDSLGRTPLPGQPGTVGAVPGGVAPGTAAPTAPGAAAPRPAPQPAVRAPVTPPQRSVPRPVQPRVVVPRVVPRVVAPPPADDPPPRRDSSVFPPAPRDTVVIGTPPT